MKKVLQLSLCLLLAFGFCRSIMATPKPAFLNAFDYSRELDGYYLVYRHHYFGLLDSVGRQIVPCQYDDIDRFYEGVAEVVRDGKHGYINQQGKVVVPLIYVGAMPFEKGEAMVVTEEGDIGYINKQGKPIQPFSQLGRPYFPGLYRKGWVIQPYVRGDRESVGEYWSLPPNASDYVPHRGFSKSDLRPTGLTPFFQSDKKYRRYGLADSVGHVIVPLLYEDADETYSWKNWIRVKKYGRFGFVNSRTGQIKIDFLYEDTQPSAYNILWAKKDGKWICLSRSGYEALSIGTQNTMGSYDHVSAYVENRAIVKLGEKMGYVDTTGKLVVALQYDKASYYQQGQAKVYQGNQWQKLDLQGNLLDKGFQNSVMVRWVQYVAFFGGIILFLLYVKRKKVPLLN